MTKKRIVSEHRIAERVSSYPTLKEYIKEQEKDPEFKDLLDRSRLRVAVARAIKLAREKAGLTQAELAKALNTTQSVIGRLESLKDNRLPSLELLVKIAEITQKRLVVDQPGLHLELVAK